MTHPARLLVLLELEHALVGTLAFEFSTSNEQIQSQTIYYSPREPPYAMAVSGKEFTDFMLDVLPPPDHFDTTGHNTSSILLLVHFL